MNYTETQVKELKEAFRAKAAKIYGSARNEKEFWQANDAANALLEKVAEILGIESTLDNAIYRLLSDIAGAIFADNQKRIDEAEVTTAHLRALDFIRKF